MDIASSITRLRVSRLYTRKALSEKTGIGLRHLIAVEQHREQVTPQDIAANSRFFRLRPEDWIKEHI